MATMPILRSFTIPDVFVTPPEDDGNTESYHCFSPSQPTATSDDLEHIHNTIEHQHDDTPTFCRDTNNDSVVMPKKCSRRVSITFSEPANDSVDVVEIIKVRKRDIPPNAEPSPAGGTMQHSKTLTFKSRASKAFNSLRNVARSNKPRLQDVFPTSADPAPAIGTPQVDLKPRRRKSMNLGQNIPAQTSSVKRRASRLARRSNISLSGLFQSPKDTPDPSSSPSAEESFAQLPLPDESFEPPSSPTSDVLTTSPSSTRRSLAPTDAGTTGTRRRLSIVGLHRIFSLSSPSPPSLEHASPPGSASTTRPPTPEPVAAIPQPEQSPFESVLPPELDSAATASPPLMTPTLTMLSSPSDGEDELGPETPTEEDHARPFSRIQSAIAAAVRSSKSLDSVASSGAPIPNTAADDSLEMRLDSLHFDDLSFDLNAF